MKTISLFLLALGGVGAVALGAAVGAPKPFYTLQPSDWALVRHPFASPAAQQRMVEAASARVTHRSLTNLIPTVGDDPARRPGMGWRLPDPDYWQQIPAEARAIPDDWSRLPVIRFTNTQLGGVREVRLQQAKNYDMWLLRDPLHQLTACISVERATRRVYFMEVTRQQGAWQLRIAHDNCYSCHPSGPRVLRPLDEPRVDHPTLARFNRILLSYGACDFGDSVNPVTHGELETASSCARCHNGDRRGRLYAIHQHTILFKMQDEATMPPDLSRAP